MRKNLLKTIIIAANVAISFIANAQAPSWQWIGTGSSGGTGTSYANNIKMDVSGNSYVTVIRNSNMGIQKYNPNGTMIWSTSTTGAALNQFGGIALDGSGNCYVSGTFYDTCYFGAIMMVANPGFTSNWAGFVAKLDPSGNFVWVQKTTKNTQGQAINTTLSGDVIVSGYTFGNPGDIFTVAGVSATISNSKKMFYLAKLDANGNGQWVKLYEGAYPSYTSIPRMRELITDNSGNIYGTGLYAASSTGSSTVDFGGVSLSGKGGEAFTFKADNNGNVLWAKQSSSSTSSKELSGQGLGVDVSGNVYTGGWMKETATFGSLTATMVSDPTYNNDLFVVKYDNSGNEQWVKVVTPVKADNTYQNQIGVDVSSNGDVYVAGYCFPVSTSTIDLGDGVTVTPASFKNNTYVVKINNTGITQWAKWNNSSFVNDKFQDIALDPAENCYVAGLWASGTGYDALAAPTGDNIFVLKLGNNPLSGIGETLAGNTFSVYPNPAKENVTIGNLPNGSTINITDITGKVFYSSVIKSEQTTISTTEFVNGVYILQVNNNGSIATKKLVVNK